MPLFICISQLKDWIFVGKKQKWHPWQFPTPPDIHQPLRKSHPNLAQNATPTPPPGRSYEPKTCSVSPFTMLLSEVSGQISSETWILCPFPGEVPFLNHHFLPDLSWSRYNLPRCTRVLAFRRWMWSGTWLEVSSSTPSSTRRLHGHMFFWWMVMEGTPVTIQNGKLPCHYVWDTCPIYFSIPFTLTTVSDQDHRDFQ